jgi:hypothetical protein
MIRYLWARVSKMWLLGELGILLSFILLPSPSPQDFVVLLVVC